MFIVQISIWYKFLYILRRKLDIAKYIYCEMGQFLEIYKFLQFSRILNENSVESKNTKLTDISII